MKIDGTTCGFISRYPTYDELETCTKVILSNENSWYPSEDLFVISSMQEDRHTSDFPRLVCFRITCVPYSSVFKYCG